MAEIVTATPSDAGQAPSDAGQAASGARRATRLPGVPERPDVEGIERELRRLWSSLDTAPAGAGGTAAQVTRICTLTLIAVVRNGRPDEAAAMAERLGARYPCRSIVLDVSPASRDRLDVATALYCHESEAPARPTVGCEQITVAASGRALARVPALVLPLLVTDLPVYIWWPDDLPAPRDPEGDLLRRLVEVADLLIVDSSAMTRPIAGLAAAAALAAPLSGGLRDLTWGRLTPWRDLVVQSFDPPPMRQALERLDRLRIRTRPGPGQEPVAGLLLGAWIAARLRWEPAGPVRREGGGVRALFWRDGGAVEQTVEGGSGPVASFECAAGGTDPWSLSMTGEADGGSTVSIEVRMGRGRPRTQAAGLAVPDDAALLAAELELAGVDGVLRESLSLMLRAAHAA
ncbi:MAG TPA: glucose-6-phosphate dehydrogenase assembly protein OpcA [bacterium]|nr:glucose-6-phosphate dehydrogenase assembly protein OpcA [bacterium]